MKRPSCDKKARYALKTKDGYVEQTMPQRDTQDPAKARLFRGEYLNSTMWDWQYGCELVPEKQLKLPKSLPARLDDRKHPKPSKLIKTRHIAILCVLIGLSAHAAPVTVIKGPVRISSSRVLYERRAPVGVHFTNTGGEKRSTSVGIVAKPIQYRPLKTK